MEPTQRDRIEKALAEVASSYEARISAARAFELHSVTLENARVALARADEDYRNAIEELGRAASGLPSRSHTITDMNDTYMQEFRTETFISEALAPYRKKDR